MHDLRFEERIRDAFDDLPVAADEATEAARAHVVQQVSRRAPSGHRPRHAGRRPAAAAVGLLVAGLMAGCAMGRTSDRAETTPSPRPAAAAEPLSATGGPGFPPAVGWNSAQTAGAVLPQAAAALSATVELADAPGDIPANTAGRLGPDDVLIQVLVYGRTGFRPANDEQYPRRTLPLRVDQGVAQRGWEGGNGLRYVLAGRVDGWLVEVAVYFGTADPAAATRRLADDQLARLILPDPCPAGAQPLTAAAHDGARDAVRAILFTGVDRSETPAAHYRNPAFATRTATSADPVPARCDAVPRDRVAVVEVRFPRLATRPELGLHTYLASVQNGQLVVWARVR
jgi:hypothetical protein